MKVLDQAQGSEFMMYHGDSCEVLKGIPTDSIHYSITSIPFASLYTYSNSDRDFGNSKNYEEFAEQYRFLLAEWYRVTMPGRLVSIHCMNLPAMKERDGYIGVKDFRGDVIRWMIRGGGSSSIRRFVSGRIPSPKCKGQRRSDCFISRSKRTRLCREWVFPTML